MTSPAEVLAPLDPARCPLGCALDAERVGTCGAIERDLAGEVQPKTARICLGLGGARICLQAFEAWVLAGRPELAPEQQRELLGQRTRPPAPILHSAADARPLPPALAEAPASLAAWDLFATVTAERAQQQELRRLAEAISHDFPRAVAKREAASLLLLGEPGTGKTFLLRILARLAADAGWSVGYTVFWRMVDRIKACRGPDSGEREEDALAVYTEPDLLVIDDVKHLAKGDPAKTEEIAHAVIAERYGQDLGIRRRATYMSSNLSVRELLDVIGKPALDRLLDGGAQPFICRWPSYRRLEPEARGPGRDYDN